MHHDRLGGAQAIAQSLILSSERFVGLVCFPNGADGESPPSVPADQHVGFCWIQTINDPFLAPVISRPFSRRITQDPQSTKANDFVRMGITPRECDTAEKNLDGCSHRLPR